MKTIGIGFATACKHKTANYRRLSYELLYFQRDSFKHFEIEDYFGFEHWLLMTRFQNERIEREHENYYLGKEVIVISLESDPSTYEFFIPNGEFAKIIKENKINELFDQYASYQKKI